MATLKTGHEFTHIDNLEVPILKFAGVIDVYHAPEFKAMLNELIGKNYFHIIIDITEATYLDSTALAVFIGIHKKCIAQEGALRIICPKGGIRRIFEITGLDHIFKMFETIEEATTDN